MANTVIRRENVYPEGTVVKAYPANSAKQYADAEEAPPASLSATETKTVTAGVLTYTTLVAGAQYFLHGAVSDSDVSVSTLGDGTHTEVDVITLRGIDGRSLTGGTWKISVNVAAGGVQTTAALKYDASHADVQEALEALSNVADGDVAVTGGDGGPYTLTFGGALVNTAIVVGIDVSGLTGAVEHRWVHVEGSA
jgi:hypothetical protein